MHFSVTLAYNTAHPAISVITIIIVHNVNNFTWTLEVDQ